MSVRSDQKDSPMPTWIKWETSAWKWLAPLLGLTALALALFLYLHSPGNSSHRLSITAGNAAGMRHQLALKLGRELEQRSLSLDLRPSAGSEDALHWVDSRKVDLALVQGGLTSSSRPNVRQVATLHVEPLHLLVKKELFRDTSASLNGLRGKTIDLEEVGSGTNALASAVLDFVGIRPRDKDTVGGYIPMHLERQQLFIEKDIDRLPDAVFLVSSLPSSTMEFLISKHGYRLVPLPFAEAFALGSFAKPGGDNAPASAAGQIVMGRIQAVTVPAFTYSVDPPVPAGPLPTLGTRLLLVAHKDVPAEAVFKLVDSTYASQFGQIERPPLDAKLLELPPEFPWHAGSLLYQRRNAPVLSGEVVESTYKGFAIFAAAASGLFVLWQWVKQYGLLARRKGFHAYITQVTRIEEKALAAEQGPPMTVPELVALRDQLNKLKTRVPDEFARGELEGSEMLSGFLVQIHDVRDYLTRLTDKAGAK
jgi:TRAP-type uncharacterized transport system substrate-binding protein